MRGKVFNLKCSFNQIRITPAYAGKRAKNKIGLQFTGDHPRLCGEKGTSIKYLIVPEGSPPPMRGKDKSTRKILYDIRITPAYAGKSYPSPTGYNIRKDHPRLCGEKLRLLYHRGEFLGSPPPMRGKAPHKKFTTFNAGITPAYAGKSSRFT